MYKNYKFGYTYTTTYEHFELVHVTYVLCMIYEYKQGLCMYVIHMSNKFLTFSESVRFTQSVLIVIQYFLIYVIYVACNLMILCLLYCHEIFTWVFNQS